MFLRHASVTALHFLGSFFRHSQVDKKKKLVEVRKKGLASMRHQGKQERGEIAVWEEGLKEDMIVLKRPHSFLLRRRIPSCTADSQQDVPTRRRFEAKQKRLQARRASYDPATRAAAYSWLAVAQSSDVHFVPFFAGLSCYRHKKCVSTLSANLPSGRFCSTTSWAHFRVLGRVFPRWVSHFSDVLLSSACTRGHGMPPFIRPSVLQSEI